MARRFLISIKRLACVAVVLGAVFASGCVSVKGATRLSSNATDAEKRELALKLFKEGADLLYVDNQAALLKFDNAHEVDPKFFEASFNAGVAAEAMGKLAEAATRFEACLAENKEQQSCLVNLLLVKAKLNDLEFAHELSERYLKEYPEAPFAMVAAAELAVYEKDFDRAEKFARAAIERDADNVEALYVMARVFYARKEYYAAKWVIKNALLLAPGHGRLQLMAGHTALALGLLHDALDAYTLAVKYQPSEEALESYGLLLLKRGKPAEALPILERLVEAKPDEAKNYLHLGNAYLVNHRFDDAKAAYLKALELNPEDKDVYFNLGLLFLNAKPKDLPEMERLKTAQGYFNTYREQGGHSSERLKEVNGYLETLQQKIELEEYSAQAEKEAAEEKAKEEEEERKAKEEERAPKEEHPDEEKSGQENEKPPHIED